MCVPCVLLALGPARFILKRTHSIENAFYYECFSASDHPSLVATVFKYPLCKRDIFYVGGKETYYRGYGIEV
jgi:hypothetical protein